MEALLGCDCLSDTWAATLDKRPEKPKLTVRGNCICPTGGFKFSLSEAVPQGSNGSILLVNLNVVAPSGMATQAITTYDVSYTKEDSPDYTHVSVLPGAVRIPVTVVT